MGLSMAERKAVGRELRQRYRKGSKTVKGQVLDELTALTGWTRRHARRVLTEPDTPARKRKAPAPAAEVPTGRSGKDEELHLLATVRERIASAYTDQDA